MNMHREDWIGGALVGAALLCVAPVPAHAHFKLLTPASWLNEDELGGPQKGSPCGPGNAQPFIGDDLQPIPARPSPSSGRRRSTIPATTASRSPARARRTPRARTCLTRRSPIPSTAT